MSYDEHCRRAAVGRVASRWCARWCRAQSALTDACAANISGTTHGSPGNLRCPGLGSSVIVTSRDCHQQGSSPAGITKRKSRPSSAVGTRRRNRGIRGRIAGNAPARGLLVALAFIGAKVADFGTHPTYFAREVGLSSHQHGRGAAELCAVGRQCDTVCQCDTVALCRGTRILPARLGALFAPFGAALTGVHAGLKSLVIHRWTSWVQGPVGFESLLGSGACHFAPVPPRLMPSGELRSLPTRTRPPALTLCRIGLVAAHVCLESRLHAGNQPRGVRIVHLFKHFVG